jgi:large subunit GTPase 1
MRPAEEGGAGVPTASEMLRAYAKARGFATTGHGQPDESRAARYILKDYVSGKLLYCHPPPHDPELDGAEFNEALYDFAHLPAKRQAWLIAHNDDINLDEGETESQVSLPVRPTQETGNKSKNLDKRFFGPGSGNAGHVTMPFNHQYTELGMQQKELTGRKAKTMAALEKDVDPAEMKVNSKKHFKGARRKARNVRETNDEE